MVSTHKDLTLSNLAHRLRKTVIVASEVANDIILLRDKPRIIDYLSVATKLGGQILETSSADFYDYFEDWRSLESDALADVVMKCLLKLPSRQIGGHEQHSIMITDLYGSEIGWVKHRQITDKTPSVDKDSDYSGPYIMEQCTDEAYAAIGRMLWENLGGHHALFGTKQNVKAGVTSGKTHRVIGLYNDDELMGQIYGSKRAIEMTDRVKKFMTCGVNRSVLLLGPPGTGKTSMMKYCAAQLGKYSLRLNVNDLEHFSAEMITDVVDVLKPECLIIDDFDRLHSSAANLMLTQLEQLNRTIKVLLVSVNNISEIDPAVIRPGRFDEIIEINDIDREVVEKLIDSDLPPKIRKELLKWPVAYINEFAKRKNVLGLEQALHEVSELKQRIEKINNRNYANHFFDQDPEHELE